MTEAEAKTKWCPMARVVVATEEDGELMFDNTPTFNRVCLPGSVFLHASCRCVGSECAIWSGGRCGLLA